MIRLPLTTAVAALALAGIAEARNASANAVSATYNPLTKRFCVTPKALEAVGATTYSERRECRTRGIWRARGIRFAAPSNIGATPR